MKLLLHICCGPCSIFPLKILRKEKIVTDGFFYNPNIHPYREFNARKEGVRQFCATKNITVEFIETYGLQEYLEKIVFQKEKRCKICYEMRLTVTAQKAAEQGYDAFSTTLLYSKYQNHDYIRKIGDNLAQKNNIIFYYSDFRTGWQEGIDESITLNLYRQSYCGCIFSEQERYDKSLRKKPSQQTQR